MRKLREMQQQQLPSYREALRAPELSNREPSPAPSYRTITPADHLSLPEDPAAVPRPTVPNTDPIRRAALKHPEALLSRLNITNYPNGIPESSHLESLSLDTLDGRLLSARTTPDGVERFHITFPSRHSTSIQYPTGGESIRQNLPTRGRDNGSLLDSSTARLIPDMVIYRGPSTGRDRAPDAAPVGQVKFNVSSASAIKVVFENGEILDIPVSMVESRQLEVELSVNGKPRKFLWLVKIRDKDASPHDHSNSRASGLRRRGSGSTTGSTDSDAVDVSAASTAAASGAAGRVGGRRSSTGAVFGIESRRRKTHSDFRLMEMQLVDAQSFHVYAVYEHEPPTRKKTETSRKKYHWGQVAIMCRAALLDDGVDKAFVMLIAFLEAYMRLHGSDHPVVENLGGLAASVGCSLM